MTSPPDASHPLKLRVSQISAIAEDIASLVLGPADEQGRAVLPPFEPGAHLSLLLPNGMTRSYSLISAPGSLDQYTIAVKSQKHSRGGSRFIHEELQVGDVIRAAAPKCSFGLDKGMAGHLFIAGGIGITPFLTLIAQAEAMGSPWRLAYATGTGQPPFIDILQAFGDQHSGRIRIYTGGRSGQDAMNIGDLVSGLPGGWGVYCCGPDSMLRDFAASAIGLDPERVHTEHFTNTSEVMPDEGFVVVLARSARQIDVAAGESILDALEMEGIDVPWGCREGLCGTCEVPVLSGVPRHYDKVLNEQQKRSNQSIIVCCSRSMTPRLVLDL